MLDEIMASRRKIVGTKQTLKALEKGEALMVLVARDAEEKVTRPVLALAEANGVETRFVDSMAELGNMCGIKVKAATAAILEY